MWQLKELLTWRKVPEFQLGGRQSSPLHLPLSGFNPKSASQTRNSDSPDECIAFCTIDLPSSKYNRLISLA